MPTTVVRQASRNRAVQDNYHIILGKEESNSFCRDKQKQAKP